jgi:chromosome segregation ATPase
MQGQLKRFQTDMQGTNEELLVKIKSLESVNYSQNDISGQMRQITEQLNNERMTNSKLGADLAKSLELCLQLQLEIQGLKARSMAVQTEDKKFSNSLIEKNRTLQRDLELTQVLKDEISMEMAKAKSAMQKEQAAWIEKDLQSLNVIAELNKEKAEMLIAIDELNAVIDEKDQQIHNLSLEIEKMSSALNDLESSAHQQTEVLKNLMGVAESKIVEMKMALDKKQMEAADYYSHLQKALAQVGVLSQENVTLKDYVNKLNYYHQQAQALQAATIAQSGTTMPPSQMNAQMAAQIQAQAQAQAHAQAQASAPNSQNQTPQTQQPSLQWQPGQGPQSSATPSSAVSVQQNPTNGVPVAQTVAAAPVATTH